jgi:hypothetical protein
MSSKAVFSLLVVICQISLSGCTASGEIQVVRAPFISPVVVPAPEQFKMNAVVKNGSTQQQGGWKLFVYTEYGAPGKFNNTSQHIFAVPSLAPNQTYAITDYDVTNGNQARCLKDQCEGHSWLVLCPYEADEWNDCRVPNILNNPQKCVHVWWQPSGRLADMVVKDC